MTNAPASLFMFDDRIVWSSDSFVGAETRRPTCALLLGVHDDLVLATRSMGTLRTRAILVGPNVARELVAEKSGFYSLTLDPAHPACRWLRDEVLAGQPFLELSPKFSKKALTLARKSFAPDSTCAQSLEISNALLTHFFPDIGKAKPIELRVEKAAAWLRAHVPHRADMKQLGEVCHLSPSRLTHLFTEELGVSIRSYLLWVRMSKSIVLLGRNLTVAEVAASIGFSDSAHLCRALRNYYSAAPSFIANRALVRVRSCDALTA